MVTRSKAPKMEKSAATSMVTAARQHHGMEVLPVTEFSQMGEFDDELRHYKQFTQGSHSYPVRVGRKTTWWQQVGALVTPNGGRPYYDTFVRPVKRPKGAKLFTDTAKAAGAI